MNKAFEDILKKLRTVAIERQGNTGMGGELVVNLDDAYDIVHEVAEEYNHGHFGCNSNGEHEKCNKCSLTDCKTRNTIWFGANDNNGWIPCSERLPEKNGMYLCAQNTYDLATNKNIIRVSTELVEFYNGKWRRAKNLVITHWQPLPEPFKERD